MLSNHTKEFLYYLRNMERQAKAQVKRQEAAQKHFDAECVRLMREEIRIVRNNGRSRIDWRNY